jgi:DNA-binding NtrC family response regulator
MKAGAGVSLMMSHLVAEASPAAIVGQSDAVERLRAQIARVARFSSSVLISGPTGTGKELVARSIHASSPRARQPFIPVDCAAISGELMSSQLFGHIAGAFTGASRETLGCFRAANRGTIFLDEIGELDYSLQSKLLRVLQERVVTPVGSHVPQPIDVRIVAATNRDLRSEVAAGRFRSDLYYRLDVVHLRTAALSQRREDIGPLAEAFLEQLSAEGLPRCTLSPDARMVLREFTWPGNVRQLRNVMEQAAIDSPSSQISADLLQGIIAASESCDGEWRSDERTALDDPSRASESLPSIPLQETHAWLTLAALEQQHIRHTLEHTYFNRSAAARLLGLTRQSLLRKIKRYGLDCGGDH